MKPRLWNALATAGCCVALLGGCGGAQSQQSPLGKVTGTVEYNGKPLPQGTIAFISEKARPASGKIKDGQIIEVTTYTSDDGAPIGKHKVTITAVDNPNADMYTKTKSLIPVKYNDPNKSGLTAEIKTGDNALKFDLKD